MSPKLVDIKLEFNGTIRRTEVSTYRLSYRTLHEQIVSMVGEAVRSISYLDAENDWILISTDMETRHVLSSGHRWNIRYASRLLP
jgi:hypothetical protein